jgi:hypothetical protein
LGVLKTFKVPSQVKKCDFPKKITHFFKKALKTANIRGFFARELVLENTGAPCAQSAAWIPMHRDASHRHH